MRKELKKIKADLHTHTSGVSFCSTVSPQQFIKAYAGTDVKTVVLTNHYNTMYMTRYGKSFDEQIEVYLNEYRTARLCGERAGIKVILGAEVAISTPENPYVEFLLYGGDEEFFTAHPRLYDLSQRELYKLCNDGGVLVYQSHPFRKEHGHFPQDPEFMDGVEINCHCNFLREEERVREFAEKYNLGICCGSDFHYLKQAGSAGTVLKGEISTPAELAAFLKNKPRPEIFYK